MSEKIGNFLIKNTTEKLNINYLREKKFYFDLSIAIIKIVAVICIVTYFKFFENIESIEDLIFPFIFLATLIFPLSTIYGLIWKPQKNFLVYDKKSKLLILRNNYFTKKKINIENKDYIKIEKNKEKLKYDNNIVYAYNYVMYYVDGNNIKTELLVVNPSKILNDYEVNIINELENKSKKIASVLKQEIGLKIISDKLKEN